MESNQCFSSGLWHVCYTEPRAEQRIVADITADLGFEAYMPVERMWVRHRGKRCEMERPVFPRYLFAQVDPHREEWQRLLDVDGVVDVLGRPAIDTAGLPSYVPVPWVEMIRKMEECGVFDRTKTEPDKFKIGEFVRVSDGPFAGMAGKIEGFAAKLKSATAKKRVKLLMDFCRVELDVTSLEKL